MRCRIVPIELPATTMPVAKARQRRNHCEGSDTCATTDQVNFLKLNAYRDLSSTHYQREDKRIRDPLHHSLNRAMIRLKSILREAKSRTIVRKNCQTSVQNAAESMLATQTTAPAARKG